MLHNSLAFAAILFVSLAHSLEIESLEEGVDFNDEKLLMMVRGTCLDRFGVGIDTVKDTIVATFDCVTDYHRNRDRRIYQLGPDYHVFFGLKDGMHRRGARGHPHRRRLRGEDRNGRREGARASQNDHDSDERRPEQRRADEFYDDFSCLDGIEIEEEWAECISHVFYEPVEHPEEAVASCVSQSVSADLFSLDILDGVYDNLYAHNEYSGDTGVDFIVLDSGIDGNHPEFLHNAVEVLGNPGTYRGNDNHGTHVAGTIGGHNVGVTKNQKVYNYPVCQNIGGSCSWADITEGYELAIALMESNPDRRYVINYSVGGGRSATNEAAYTEWGQRINAAGGLWVTSAGNSQADACLYAPAFSDWAVTVGAYGSDLEPAEWFTNYGDCVDIWGPGEYVVSAMPDEAYASMSGTSMASPNVCGLVAQYVASDYSITLDQVKANLLASSFELSNCPRKYGHCKAAFLTCSENAQVNNDKAPHEDFSARLRAPHP